jgi:hypothetical protein
MLTNREAASAADAVQPVTIVVKFHDGIYEATFADGPHASAWGDTSAEATGQLIFNNRQRVPVLVDVTQIPPITW